MHRWRAVSCLSTSINLHLSSVPLAVLDVTTIDTLELDRG